LICRRQRLLIGPEILQCRKADIGNAANQRVVLGRGRIAILIRVVLIEEVLNLPREVGNLTLRNIYDGLGHIPDLADAAKLDALPF
jgi:hypothetical protein